MGDNDCLVVAENWNARLLLVLVDNWWLIGRMGNNP